MDKEFLSAESISLGSISLGTIVPDYVFHAGPNEVRITSKGMIYRVRVIEDAGEAHRLLTDVLRKAA